MLGSRSSGGLGLSLEINGSSISICEGQMVFQQAVLSLCTGHKGFYYSGNSDKLCKGGGLCPRSTDTVNMSTGSSGLVKDVCGESATLSLLIHTPSENRQRSDTVALFPI